MFDDSLSFDDDGLRVLAELLLFAAFLMRRLVISVKCIDGMTMMGASSPSKYIVDCKSANT